MRRLGLPALFKAAGIPIPSIEIVQTSYSTAEAKTLP
jgi:hypothetical protein